MNAHHKMKWTSNIEKKIKTDSSNRTGIKYSLNGEKRVKSNTNQLNESKANAQKNYKMILKPNSEVKWSGFSRKYEMKMMKKKTPNAMRRKKETNERTNDWTKKLKTLTDYKTFTFSYNG